MKHKAFAIALFLQSSSPGYNLSTFNESEAIMRASRNALDLIKLYESCKLDAYEDVGGVWTVGWGTTGPGINERTSVSQGVADAMLVSDVAQISQDLSPLVGYYVNQNQYDALVSLVYNIGLNAFKKSTLLKCIQDHDPEEAAKEFSRWVHADGTVVPGLVARREAESKLFSTPLAI